MTKASITCPARLAPRIGNAGWFYHPPDDFTVVYNCPTHCIHQYSYATTIRLGTASYALRPGDVTFSPAGVDIAYRHTVGGHHWCVHWFPDAPGREALSFPPVFRPGRRAGHVSELLRDVFQTFHRPRPGVTQGRQHERAGVRLLDAFHALRDMLAGTERPPAPRGADALESLLAYLEGHIATQESAAELAARAGLSQNYCARLFRERCGMTIREYLARRRVEHALQLMATTALPVGSIGRLVGMPDPQYFNKQFRRIAGRSPSVARAEARHG